MESLTSSRAKLSAKVRATCALCSVGIPRAAGLELRGDLPQLLRVAGEQRVGREGHAVRVWERPGRGHVVEQQVREQGLGLVERHRVGRAGDVDGVLLVADHLLVKGAPSDESALALIGRL